ncbi:MAG: hypothetical protein HRT45_19050 [Bdellovibrionales bacterium]|nr:hypothetical protein [Bdellovibrionales bacterium]
MTLAGDPQKSITLPKSPDRNRAFYNKQAKIFQLLKREVRKLSSKCLVGMHTGHYPVDHIVEGDSQSMLASAVSLMKPHLRPDFLIYGAYIKARPTLDIWKLSMRKRVPILKAAAPRVYLMNQLHVVNNFQHGAYRAPSKDQLWENYRLAVELGVAGYGYYAKDTKPAGRVSNVNYQNVAIKRGAREFIGNIAGTGCWARETSGNSARPNVFEDLSPKGKDGRVFFNRHRGIGINMSCTDAEDSENYDRNTETGWVFETSPYRWEDGMRILDHFRSQ